MDEPSPDLAVLQALVAVAEHGSIGAAAAALGLTQPSVSRSLARYERRIGLTLLERSPRGTRLTTEGSIVVDWSREVLDAADRLAVATTALRTGRGARLRVAASMTVAEYLAPRWLEDFRRGHPDVVVELVVANSDRVGQLLREAQADVGFIETSAVPKGPRWTAVARDTLVVVVAPTHPWARRRRPVSRQELAATSLVVREEGSGTRRTFTDACAAAGLVVAAPALELSSNAAVRISVMSGGGAAVLSDLAVREQIAAGALVAIPVAGLDLSRRLRAGWIGGPRPIGPAAGLVAIARRVGGPPPR